MKTYLIAGLPGTGKTSFGDWLEKEKGFRHIDMEKNFRYIQPLYSLWQKAADGITSFDAFRDELGKIQGKVVMTWGFPPHAIDLAKEIGVTASCWWFDGPRHFARSRWLKREGHTDDKYFRIQCDEIDSRKAEIQNFFHPNIVSVFTESGDFISRDIIAKHMLAE